MIRRRVRFVADVVAQASFIERDDPAAAERLIAATERLLATLERMPRLGCEWMSPLASLRGTRVRGVPGFASHLLFYRPVPDGIEALTMVHAARDLHRALADEAE